MEIISKKKITVKQMGFGLHENHHGSLVCSHSFTQSL